MSYKTDFQEIINKMGADFNWTIDYNKDEINNLIKNEIGEKHELFNKEIIPIAICKNKYDLFAYYKESNQNIFVTIHFL